MFPQLRKLEEKYANELVVIGVHSAKFTTEKETDNLRKAILRNEIHHPVLNDREFKVWNLYGIQAWPTLALIDPTGKLIGMQSGETVLEVFDPIISKVIEDFDKAGLIDRRPISFAREQSSESVLSFPGKVLAHASSGNLCISDSNHNRVIVATLDGNVKAVIGSGKAGFNDGSFETATFDKPQGLAVDGDLMYVADTENHAIRVVDFAQRTVSTLAGNGTKGYPTDLPARGKKASLNSPWDLELVKGVLYVAMAGTHQIWAIDTKSQAVRVHAGSGREGLLDNQLRFAWLAQPSGITSDGKILYFADAEVSAVRAASIESGGQVRTIVGQDLFVFGDVDGVGDAVRLQHPLGICWADGVLYIADAYNNKIKRVDPRTRRCETVFGTGNSGDGANEFHEPGDVSYANGLLYIADTNNHRIQVADLQKKQLTTLQLKGMPPLPSTSE